MPNQNCKRIGIAKSTGLKPLDASAAECASGFAHTASDGQFPVEDDAETPRDNLPSHGEAIPIIIQQNAQKQKKRGHWSVLVGK